MNCIGLMNIPTGFKIRKKSDTYIFMRDCMNNNNEYMLKINDELALFIKKTQSGTIAVLKKYGDLCDPFNPLVEVANTTNRIYEETVQDYIWKYRKYINEKWFS